jgi:hypothetical protein
MWMWIGLLLLGAYHGLNPAMGWLFAVALGMQDKSGKAVVESLLPLGLGHLASVAAVVGVAELAAVTLPLRTIRILAGVLLIVYAFYKLLRRRHPRWVGMRVGPKDLAFWSFLMASAHGAGLMLLPFVLAHAAPAAPAEHQHHIAIASAIEPPSGMVIKWWLSAGLHTLGYLLVTALAALLVYYKLGVAVLRKAWFNFDWLWVGALLASGILTLVV